METPSLTTQATATEYQRRRVDVTDPTVEVYGIDCIWHNMDVSSPDFTTFRKSFGISADEIVQRIAVHLAQGLYELISLNVAHSCVVVCKTDKSFAEFAADWLVG